MPGIWDQALADEVWGAPTEPAYDLARQLVPSLEDLRLLQRTDSLLGVFRDGRLLVDRGLTRPAPVGAAGARASA